VNGSQKPLAEFARTRTALIVALMLVTGWTVLSPVLGTGYYADDLHNSQRSATLETLDESIWSYSVANTRQWMTNEGRFFPVSALENSLIFGTVHDRAVYKALQAAAGAAMAMLLGTLAAILARNRLLGLIVGLLALSGMQLRFWYDPIHSFGMLLPSLAIKLLLTLILVLVGLRTASRPRATAAFVVAGLVWTAGLLQYEIVYMLAPLPLLLVWHERSAERWQRWAAAGSVIVPTFVLANYVATLRSSATPSPAYATNFALDQFVPTAVYQVVGAIPGSASLFAAGVPDISALLGDLSPWSLIGALSGGTAAWLLASQIQRPPIRSVGVLGAIGAGFWLLPAIPIALSMRWQHELGWGFAYLPVVIQSLGLALLAVGVTFFVIEATHRVLKADLLPTPPSWAPSALRALFGLMIAGILLIVIAGNRWVGDQLTGFRIQQETTDAAISSGFLSHVTDSSTLIVTRLPGGNLYYNDPYVTWRGGPTGIEYLTSVPDDAVACGNLRLCTTAGRQLFHLREFIDDNGSIFVAAGAVAGQTPNAGDPLIDLDNARVFGPGESMIACNQEKGAALNDWRGWGIGTCSGFPAPMSSLVDLVTSAGAIGINTPTNELIAAAIGTGFFDRVPDGASIVSNPGGPLSGAYFTYLGGPVGLTFLPTAPEGSEACSPVQVCTPAGEPLFVLRVLTMSDGSLLLVLAPVATLLPTDLLILIEHSTIFGRDNAVPPCDLNDPSHNAIDGSSDQWIIRQCSGPPTAATSLFTWVSVGCGPELVGWPPCNKDS
jgi:hypothetical protein